MSITVDTNVLVYASNESDASYGGAAAVVARLAGGPDIAYLFWPVLLGYLRIVTHPAILPRPLSATEAMRNISSLLARPHVRTPGEAAGFWHAFETAAQPGLRGNDVPDVHIVALMRQNGVRSIYTRDRGFRRYDGIEVLGLSADE